MRLVSIQELSDKFGVKFVGANDYAHADVLFDKVISRIDTEIVDDDTIVKLITGSKFGDGSLVSEKFFAISDEVAIVENDFNDVLALMINDNFVEVQTINISERSDGRVSAEFNARVFPYKKGDYLNLNVIPRVKELIDILGDSINSALIKISGSTRIRNTRAVGTGVRTIPDRTYTVIALTLVNGGALSFRFPFIVYSPYRSVEDVIRHGIVHAVIALSVAEGIHDSIINNLPSDFEGVVTVDRDSSSVFVMSGDTEKSFEYRGIDPFGTPGDELVVFIAAMVAESLYDVVFGGGD